MTIAFYQQLERWLHEGDVAIATVMQVSGSVPREVGAKMLVNPHGNMLGTVGGGAGEAKVLQYAQMILLDDGVGRVGDWKGWVTVDLTGGKRDTQGVCGGTMHVWVERWSNPWGGAIARHIVNSLQAKRAATLVTPCDSALHPDSHPYLAPEPMKPIGLNATAGYFVECIEPPPTLLIIGAGHVGVALAQIAQFAGFQVVVQDDRPEYLMADRFPPPIELLPGAIAPGWNRVEWPQNLYIALVTRGVATDLDALTVILKQHPDQTPRYLGMIGSRKRIHYVFRELQQQGIAGDRLAMIRAPIGLEIGALTPEEIAISICAELIQVRRTHQLPLGTLKFNGSV